MMPPGKSWSCSSRRFRGGRVRAIGAGSVRQSLCFVSFPVERCAARSTKAKLTNVVQPRQGCHAAPARSPHDRASRSPCERPGTYLSSASCNPSNLRVKTAQLVAHSPSMVCGWAPPVVLKRDVLKAGKRIRNRKGVGE